MTPFFKNDGYDISTSYIKTKPYDIKYANVKTIDNFYYDVVDDIFESVSGNYYVWCWDNDSSIFKPLNIEEISEVAENSSYKFKFTTVKSFLHNHLKEYKLKMERRKKLDRIIK